jgi:hypothetical protein
MQGVSSIQMLALAIAHLLKEILFPNAQLQEVINR